MSQDPLYPDFPREEFDLRWARARKLMADKGLSGLLVTAPVNYMYFTGHRSDQIVADKIRVFIFLLPLEHDPICFVPAFEVGHVRSTTWITDIRPCPIMGQNEVIADAFRELGLRGKVGCEMGREQYLGMNFNDFNDLRHALGDDVLVDAAELLLEVRAVKSPREVERLRQACGLTARAIDRAFDQVRPGMTTRDVARLVRMGLMDGGATRVNAMPIAAGYDFSQGKTSVPTSRPIEVGDTLSVDCAAEVQGYNSDVTRTAVIGKATSQQRDMYEMVFDLNHKLYASLRPGNLCEDVFLTCERELKRLGRNTQAVGRIGHGVGCDPAEYPSLKADEKIQILPGMVFACNATFTTEFGFFNIEDDLVVTDSGSEVIVDPPGPRELRILG